MGKSLMLIRLISRDSIRRTMRKCIVVAHCFCSLIHAKSSEAACEGKCNLVFSFVLAFFFQMDRSSNNTSYTK